MKNLLLIIDPQNDFVDKSGSLYVPGSEKAIDGIVKFIKNTPECFSSIVLSQDSHYNYHVGHSEFWKENPQPGTIITAEEIKAGKYNPLYEEDREQVLLGIARNNQPIQVWPTHCVRGSWGWCFPDRLVSAVNDWSTKHHSPYQIVQKGTIATHEAYSLLTEEKFTLNIPAWRISEWDHIYICGVCGDVCVYNTVKDLLGTGDYENKLVFIESGIANFDPESENLKIYQDACDNHGAWRI